MTPAEGLPPTEKNAKLTPEEKRRRAAALAAHKAAQVDAAWNAHKNGPDAATKVAEVDADWNSREHKVLADEISKVDDQHDSFDKDTRVDELEKSIEEGWANSVGDKIKSEPVPPTGDIKPEIDAVALSAEVAAPRAAQGERDEEKLYKGDPRHPVPAVTEEGKPEPAAVAELIPEEPSTQTSRDQALPKWYKDRIAQVPQETHAKQEAKATEAKIAEGIRTAEGIPAAVAAAAKMSERTLDRATKIGTGFEKTVGLLRSIGEAYKKAPLWKRAAFGLALAGTGFFIAGPAGLGAASLVGRTLGGLGIFATLDAVSRPRGNEKPATKDEVARFIANASGATLFALLVPQLFHGAAELIGADKAVSTAVDMAADKWNGTVPVDINNPNTVAGFNTGEVPVDPVIDNSVVGSYAQNNEYGIENSFPEQQNPATAEFRVAAPYTVVPGDNLTEILRKHMPGFEDLSRQEQDTRIANLLEKVQQNPRAYGIPSGDINAIREGNIVRLDLMQSVMKGGDVAMATPDPRPWAGVTAPSDVPTPGASELPPQPVPRPEGLLNVEQAFQREAQSIFNNAGNPMGDENIKEYLGKTLSPLGEDNFGPDAQPGDAVPGKLHGYLVREFSALPQDNDEVKRLGNMLGWKSPLLWGDGTVGNNATVNGENAIKELLKVKAALRV